MSTIDKYSVFYCAIASDQHFLEKPLTLSCGHSICQQCIPNRSSPIVKCGICNEINHTDLTKVKESFVIKKLITVNLCELFGVLEERFYSSLESLKGIKKIEIKKENYINLFICFICRKY
jgi:hypothetical protein